MSQNEKKWNRKYGTRLMECDIISTIIPDHYVPHKGKMVTTKKPYDRVVTVSGFALEFKYCNGGKTYNVAGWRKNQPHQIENLKRFTESGCGFGILMFFWKPTGKRDIQIKFLFSWEAEEIDKIAFEDMHDEDLLREKMYEWKSRNQKAMEQIRTSPITLT